MKLFKNLYDYRELLKTNVKKDIRGKYKGSFFRSIMVILKSIINGCRLCHCISLYHENQNR